MVRRSHTTTTSTSTSTTSLLLTPPKKKKGRPSLHDLQQRKLLQQLQQQQLNNNNNNDHINPNNNNNPNSSNSPPRRIRSSRRTNNVPAQFLLGSDSDSDDSPLSPSHPHSHPDSDSDSDDERVARKVRRLSSNRNPKINPQDEKGWKATDTHNETRMLAGPTNASTSAAASSATSLPDRKLLLLVLDRLQKKDTRGVFAEPVDPEELPDYHEVIENPMDFGTVRSNLDRGIYKTLEQFEDDVYLISSNAMQYNPPSTIFFRQARSIQELAKKEFETLRQDAGLSDPPPKPRRGRPPGSRNLKKLLERSPVDHVVAESPSDTTPATHASREDDATRSGLYNLRKGPSLYRFPRKLDNCFDYSASSSRYMSTKYGKLPCGSEENRRETYFSSQFDSDQDSLAALGGSERQLIAVGPSSDHTYARSLARFGGDLGPVVWSIVSKKLRSILPPSVDFGPGWVEENKALSTQLSPLPEKLVQSSSLVQDSFNNKPHSPLTSGFTNSAFAPKLSAASGNNFAGAGELNYNGEWSSLNGINGVTAPGPSHQTQPAPQFQEGLGRPTSSSFCNPFMVSNAFENSTSAALSNLHSPPVDYHSMMNPESDMGAHGTPYWKNLSVPERWDRLYPAELNGGFQASSSRNSTLQIGSPPQLDLVLQL